MKFKVDENLPIEVAEVLKRGGHQASTVVDEGLEGASDRQIAKICRREKRALITLDVGFADLRAYPPGEYPGLIVFRLSRQDKAYVLNILTSLTASIEQEELMGKLWIVQENRIRIRG